VILDDEFVRSQGTIVDGECDRYRRARAVYLNASPPVQAGERLLSARQSAKGGT
jgi:hypothetical protein